MAGVSSKFVHIERLKERFLECDICKEIFDEENHHPRLLPCLHTLCNDCIVKLVADEQIKCPRCQKFHNVPGNCIETFKKDNTRRDLLDFVNVQKEPSSLPCESCDKKLPAKFRCKDCSEVLCTECYSYHEHNKKFKTHYVFSIDSIEFKIEQLENFKHESSCSIPEHSDALKFYCDKSTCKKPICTTCAIAEHKESNGHIVRDILEVYSQEKAQMELKKATLKEKKEMALSIAKSIEQEENDLYQHGETAKENIMAQFETCFKILERRRDQLVQDLDVTITRKNKVLEAHKRELESLNELITDAVSFYDQSLLYKNYPAFLEIVRTIEDRFKYLIDQTIDPVPHENACVEFTPASMGMEFQTYANTTGKVYHTSVYPPNTMIEIQQLENQEREVLISVTFRDEFGNEITNLDTMPEVIVRINSEKEPMESVEIPCELSDAGRYKAVTKGLSPGKYKIETIMFKKCFGADVKEIEYKEDEHKTTVEDGKAKDLLTTPMAEHKTTTEDGKAKDQLTPPITEQEKTDEDGKPKDLLPIQIADRELQPPRRTVRGIKVGSDDDINEHRELRPPPRPFGGFPVGSFHDEFQSDDAEFDINQDELGPFDDEYSSFKELGLVHDESGQNQIKEWIRQNFLFLVVEIEWTRLKSHLLLRDIRNDTILAEIEQSIHYRKQRVERLLLESISFNAPKVLDVFNAIKNLGFISNTTLPSKTKQHHESELEMDERHACTKCSKSTLVDLLSMCGNIPEEVYFELLRNGHLRAAEVLNIHKCCNNIEQIAEFLRIIRSRPFQFSYFVAAVLSVARQGTLLNLTKIIDSLEDVLCEDLKTSFAIEKPKKEKEFEKRKKMEDNVLLTGKPKKDKIKASHSPKEEKETDPKELSDNIFAIVTLHAVKGVDSKLLEKILQRKEKINKSIKEYGQITDAWLGTVDIVIQLKSKSAQNVPKRCIDKIVQQILKDEEIQEIIQSSDVEMDLKIDITKDVKEDDENEFQKRKLAIRTHFSYIKEHIFVGSFTVEFQRNEIMDEDSFVDEFQFGTGGSLQKSAQKFLEYIIKSDSEKVMEAFFKVLNEESYYKDIFKKLTDYVQKLKISEKFEYGLKPECVNTEVKMVSDLDLSVNDQTCLHTVSLNKDKNDALAQAQTETDIVPLNPSHFPLFENTTVIPISVKIFQNVNIINKKQATVIGSKGINIQLGSDDLSTENENFVAVGKGKKMVCYKRESDKKEEDEEDDSEDSADDDGLDGNENSNGDDTSHVNRGDAGADLCRGVCTVHSLEGIVDSGNICCSNRDPVHTDKGCDDGNRDHVCSSENLIGEHRDDSDIENCNDDDSCDISKRSSITKRDDMSDGCGGDKSNEGQDDTGNVTRYKSCSVGVVSRGSNVISKHDSCGSGKSGDHSSGDGYYSGNENDCFGFSGDISRSGNDNSRDDIVRGACVDHINEGGDGNGGEDCEMSNSVDGVGDISEGQCHEGNIERNRVDTNDTKHRIRLIDDNPSIMV